MQNFFTFMPNGDRRAEIAESFEVFLEERLNFGAKLVRVDLHAVSVIADCGLSSVQRKATQSSCHPESPRLGEDDRGTSHAQLRYTLSWSAGAGNPCVKQGA